MAYGLLATIPFISLNGTQCSIEVWKQGYTGSTVPHYTLSPAVTGSRGYAAADPFYFEEDSSHDLLKFVRVKTGYIRLVEAYNDSLSFLYPSKEFEMYVRVYYGPKNTSDLTVNLVFTGYIQCAEYSQNWVAPPQVKEFPVTSPMGMLAAKSFSTWSPQMFTMGDVLGGIMDNMALDYKYVIWPGGRENYQGTIYGKVAPWDGKIHSTAICPFNPDFNHFSDAADLYAPQNYAFFIEGLCASQQWILHDTPDSLVFTEFDNTDTYTRMTKAQLRNIPGYSEKYYDDWVENREQIEDYFSLDGDDGKLSEEKPLKKLTIKVDGVGTFSKPSALEYTNRCGFSVQRVGTGDDHVDFLQGHQVGPMATSDHWADVFGNVGVCPGGVSPVNFTMENNVATSVNISRPGMSWLCRYSPSWSASSDVLRLRYFGPITTFKDLVVQLTIRAGEDWAHLEELTPWNQYVELFATANGDISLTVYEPNVQQQLELGYTVKGLVIKVNNPCARVINSLDVGIRNIRNLGNKRYMQIDLNVIDPNDYTYQTQPPKDEFVFTNDQYGIEEKSISCSISNIAPSNNSYGDKDGDIDGDVKLPLYMFVPQQFLEVPMERRLTALPTNVYLPRYEYWKASDRANPYHWRIIALSFHPRDDEYRVTMCHTSNITPTS